jgi:hypothetical protein
VSRPAKISNVLSKVRDCLEVGKYRYVGHANQRLQERSVTRLEVKQALKKGYHEKRKDEFKEEHYVWNYSIRGKTIDGRELRVALSFDKSGMLVVTVIDLKK